MRKLLLGTVAILALVAANAAQAADLGVPAKGPMAAPLPAWNWSGFYAGLNAGYARGTTVWNDLDATFTLGGTLLNESINGFIGGGQIGYNWQFRHAVVGVETDFNYLSLKQTTGFFDNVPGSGFAKFALTDAVRWLGTVRGRAGLALDNVLIYLTAGLAYGRTEHTVTVVGVPPPVTPTVAHDFSGTKVGAVAGVGTEYALDPRWPVKAEALYVDLGRADGNLPRRGWCYLFHCQRSPGNARHDVDCPRRRELQVRRLTVAFGFLKNNWDSARENACGSCRLFARYLPRALGPLQMRRCARVTDLPQ